MKDFYFHVLDDTPPEDDIPLVFPELEQQLQVSIFLWSLSLFLLSFIEYSEWKSHLIGRLICRQSGDFTSSRSVFLGLHGHELSGNVPVCLSGYSTSILRTQGINKFLHLKKIYLF